MKTVHKSVLIWYSPQEMYMLVTDARTTTEFLKKIGSLGEKNDDLDGMWVK
jgi:ribosome-associated toxin RatA of RatAB toxin-antitoxin module